MPKLNAEAKLFGIDLRQTSNEVKAAFQQLMAVLRLDRWLPTSQMQVCSQPGRVANVRAGQWLGWSDAAPKTAAQQQGKVFLLEEQYLLLRNVALPAMPAQAVVAALTLEVQTLSPFDASETLWAYRMPPAGSREGSAPAAPRQYGLVITSRALVAQACSRAGVQAQDDWEVWAQMAEAPVLLHGFGEAARLRKERRKLQGLLVGTALLGLLVMAIALTPTLQLRARAIDAYQQLQVLSQQTQPQLAQRQQLQAAIEAVEQARAQQLQRIDHMQLLQQLTQVLPDDVALQSLSLRQQTLTLQGVSDNASAVVQLLAGVPGLKDVRFPSAVTRVPNSPKENFVLTAEIDMASVSAPKVQAGAQP